MKKIIFLLVFYSFFPINTYANEVTIVDINFLLKNSEKGKKIQKELDNLGSKQKKNFEKKQKDLKEKENKIISKKNVLSAEDFKKEIELFKSELRKFNDERRKSIQEMNAKQANMISKLLEDINKILINYSKEKNISTIIDKKNVIITKAENDITKEILSILNK